MDYGNRHRATKKSTGICAFTAAIELCQYRYSRHWHYFYLLERTAYWPARLVTASFVATGDWLVSLAGRSLLPDINAGLSNHHISACLLRWLHAASSICAFHYELAKLAE